MPLYHSSASVLGFCMALIKGATICIGKKFSTKTFWRDCRSSNATVIQYVGETCRYLLSAPPEIHPETGENLDKKHHVRMAFGNGLRPDIWNRFKERFGIQEIAEFYSATEGTAGAWNFSRNDFSKGAIGRLGTVGKLLTHSTSAVVELDWETEQPWRDPETRFCRRAELGQPGELIFEIDAKDIEAKFQGYFNNKSSTESKILRDVLKKGDAWFRTGDMIIWDAEGRSFFSDRIGDTFRWKAENVSTNEVSEALGNHSSVLEANVYGVELPHHDGRAGCVALVLAEEPSERVLGDLARHAQERLPRFAVPIFLRLISEMQITGTNKQQKHVVRSQGVDPKKVKNDALYWLKDGTYVKFTREDWEELNSGRVKL
jgi:acyl-CoA synthetase (AMP-forming)/AMP-acid ligase II